MKKILVISLKFVFLLVWIMGCKKEDNREYPIVNVELVTEISTTSVVSGGFLVNQGNPPVSECGLCWNTTGNPTINDSKITGNPVNNLYRCNINGLNPGTKYYIRAFATNDVGTAYSSIEVFNTLGSIPNVVTGDASEVQMTSIILSGTLKGNHLATNVIFEYGTTTSYGNTLALQGNPIISVYDTVFSVLITGLSNGTSYHYRIKAINDLGTSYGNDQVCTTLAPVTDIDGNTYNVVSIGNQVWMTENLKVTHYNDGTPIPLETSNTLWSEKTSDAYCWYNNDETTYKNPYGALYNGYAAQSTKLCPVGWHVATAKNWSDMEIILGGSEYAGGNIKETGLDHWLSPNTGATNSSGFTALPGGNRYYRLGYGGFNELGNTGFWWTNSRITYEIFTSSTYLHSFDSDLWVGNSVRCVKN